MQAIHTQYKPATNTLGARIIARAKAGHIILPYDDALSPEENGYRAAKALCDILGWTHRLYGGTLADGSGVFVQEA